MDAYGIYARDYGRSPSWGAWIEIFPAAFANGIPRVAPPRGERGLKSGLLCRTNDRIQVAPPRGERGLKLLRRRLKRQERKVAPPRGERGLKFATLLNKVMPGIVAPPRGERGLKYYLIAGTAAMVKSRSPSWGAWIEIRHGGGWRACTASLPLVGSVD